MSVLRCMMSGTEPPTRYGNVEGNTSSGGEMTTSFQNADHPSFSEARPEIDTFPALASDLLDINYITWYFSSRREKLTSNNNEGQNSEPYLVITEQPVKSYRFRYESERKGRNLVLFGRSSKKKNKSYPSVELRNFNGEACIRVSLYSPPGTDGKRYIHCNRLVRKYEDGLRVDPHYATVNVKDGYSAVFQDFGIIHTPKKDVISELIKKKQNRHQEFCEESELSFTHKIEYQATVESKSIDRNIVSLCFETFVKDEKTGRFVPLCEPVFSDPIKNTKNIDTAELKICEMDKSSSPVQGDEKIFMLVEKIKKRNIQIKFYKLNKYDKEVWCDYGKFTEKDIHHQFAIVFYTPRYPYLIMGDDVEVLVALYRPSDGEASKPWKFHYTSQKESCSCRKKGFHRTYRQIYENDGYDTHVPVSGNESRIHNNRIHKIANPPTYQRLDNRFSFSDETRQASATNFYGINRQPQPSTSTSHYPMETDTSNIFEEHGQDNFSDIDQITPSLEEPFSFPTDTDPLVAKSGAIFPDSYFQDPTSGMGFGYGSGNVTEGFVPQSNPGFLPQSNRGFVPQSNPKSPRVSIRCRPMSIEEIQGKTEMQSADVVTRFIERQSLIIPAKKHRSGTFTKSYEDSMGEDSDDEVYYDAVEEIEETAYEASSWPWNILPGSAKSGFKTQKMNTPTRKMLEYTDSESLNSSEEESSDEDEQQVAEIKRMIHEAVQVSEELILKIASTIDSLLSLNSEICHRELEQNSFLRETSVNSIEEELGSNSADKAKETIHEAVQVSEELILKIASTIESLLSLYFEICHRELERSFLRETSVNSIEEELGSDSADKAEEDNITDAVLELSKRFFRSLFHK